MRETALLSILGAALCGAALCGTASGAGDPPPPMAGGIWKAVVPARPMASEFQGYDPLGIAAGARIRADCSLNWVDPDDGKRYCFSSGTSLEMFLEMPHTHIARARARWRKLEGAAR